MRRGFTLLELIVAISIIAILIGMLVVFAPGILGAGNERATRVTLGNLQSMLTELETTGGLNRLRFDDYNSDGVMDFPPAIVAPESVVGDQPDRIGAAVQLTRDAMTIILAVPANQSAIGQLPPEQLRTFDSGARNRDTPVVLDAWGNPILFVFPPDTQGVHALDDRYGLRGLSVEGQPGEWRVVNPGGVESVTASAPRKYPSTTSEAAKRLPHFRPFWVSAGPDGDFRTHDDNIYSFDN